MRENNSGGSSSSTGSGQKPWWWTAGTSAANQTSPTRFRQEYDRQIGSASGPLLPGEAQYDYNPRSVANAYENRWDPQPVLGSYGAEVFQSIPVNGSPQFIRDQYWQYTSYSMADAADMFYSQPVWAQQAFKDAADEYNRVNQYNTSANAMYKRMLVESKMLASEGIFRSPVEILYDKVNVGSLSFGQPGASDSSGSGSSGGYSGGGGYGGYGGGGYGGGGSVGTVNISNPEDARAVINTMALQMIGRTVTDREFKQYYKALNKVEMANPATVSMGTDADGNPVQVVEGGLGAEGRTAALQDIVRDNPNYNEFTLGSQTVNLMSRWLQERGIFRG